MYNNTHLLGISAYSDFRLVFRTPALRTFLFLPVFIIAVLNGFLPYLVEKYNVVIEYVPYVIMASVLQTSTMFGLIYSVVLIDEKDTGVNKVYGILPVSNQQMIVGRLLFPFLFAMLFSSVILLLQPFYLFSIGVNISISFLSAFIGPIFALLITNYSSNKMQGFTWYKGINGAINLPILVFFIPEYFAPLFYWIPSHWVFQVIDQYLSGKLYLWSFLIGFGVSVLILGLLVKRFSRRHFV